MAVAHMKYMRPHSVINEWRFNEREETIVYAYHITVTS